jgi:hypothetical protein
MSLIGTAIGALVALLPPALLHPKGDKPKSVQIPVESEVERLRTENARLTRSHARLVDHIETLEREILLEQHICAHWKEEAERLAKHAIASRLRAETQEQQALMARYQDWQPLPANPLAGPQQNLANYANQAQTQQQAYAGFCNCVPSRAQVWGEQAQADAAAERLARLRP